MRIEQEIDDLIRKSGASYRQWYVGVAIHPREQLFNGHNVDEKRGLWIYRDAYSEIEARRIEAFFLKKNCQGGPVRKDSSRHIYAYKMTRETLGRS